MEALLLNSLFFKGVVCFELFGPLNQRPNSLPYPAFSMPKRQNNS